MKQALAIAAAIATLAAAAASADVTPRLWSSYAIVSGGSNVVLGEPLGPIQVSAMLPERLTCSVAVAARAGHLPTGAAQANPLLGAPVTVVLDRTPCTGGWADRWVHFTVSGTGAADILDVTFTSRDGRSLGGERIAVETTGR